MEKRLKVVLYGDTLVLAGLRASLSSCATLDLSDVDGLAATPQELLALRPNVVIFDIGAAQPAFQYQLAELMPDLLLIGIDPAVNRVQVWSGRQMSGLSTGDLVRVISQSDGSVPFALATNSFAIPD